MKILLSAYACEPNKGSEPGVGWNWALKLAEMGYQVTVLTRANNRSTIEPVLNTLPSEWKLEFVYYDLPHWVKFWKIGARGVHLYYFLWQIGIIWVAQKQHAAKKFDIVHHVTFVNVRKPSFMWLLGIPFIFGPVAGGERSPFSLRKSLPLRGQLLELIRDIQILLVKIDPLVNLTLGMASHIYVTTDETLKLLPNQYKKKAHVQLAIGCNPDETLDSLPSPVKQNEKYHILFVGQLLYLKGIHLAIQALSKINKQYQNISLTIIGSGPDEAWLKDLAMKMSLTEFITWIPYMEHSKLLTEYRNYDLFVFPSLHDTGGTVVLEALGNGLPVVCLDLGGPAIIVNERCGRVIQTDKREEIKVVHDLASAIIDIYINQDIYKSLRENALERVKDFYWNRLVTEIASKIDNYDNHPKQY
jgi:glycosyltransferase involved in cell wall biosynthesis